MPSILIDLPEEDLRAIEKVAKGNHRSRKAQVELIVEDWVVKELGT